MAELAIVREGGGPIRPYLHGTQVQHAGSRATLECRDDGGAPIPNDGVVVRCGWNEARKTAGGYGECEG
jgi:hypothetical protein